MLNVEDLQSNIYIILSQFPWNSPVLRNFYHPWKEPIHNWIIFVWNTLLLLDSLSSLWLQLIGLCSLPRTILGLFSFFSHIGSHPNNWRFLSSYFKSCSYHGFEPTHLIQCEGIWLSTDGERVFLLTSYASWNRFHPSCLPSSIILCCGLWLRGSGVGGDTANVMFIDICVYVYRCFYTHTYAHRHTYIHHYSQVLTSNFATLKEKPAL